MNGVVLKSKSDTVCDFYSLKLEIYCDCDSILLLLLRLVRGKNDYLNSCDDKNDAFCDLFCDSSSLCDHAYP